MSLALVGPAVAALQSLLRVPDCLVALNAPYVRPLRAPAIVLLNRLLLEREECSSKDGMLSAELEATDPRTQHVAEVLRAENGDSLRAGVLDGGRPHTIIFRSEKRNEPFCFSPKLNVAHRFSLQNKRVERPFLFKTEMCSALHSSSLSQRHDLAKVDDFETLSL